jgi:hypothetical protein
MTAARPHIPRCRQGAPRRIGWPDLSRVVLRRLRRPPGADGFGDPAGRDSRSVTGPSVIPDEKHGIHVGSRRVIVNAEPLLADPRRTSVGNDTPNTPGVSESAISGMKVGELRRNRG